MQAIIRSCKLVSKISRKGSRFYAFVLDLGYSKKTLWLDLNTFAELLGLSCQDALEEVKSVIEFSVDVRDLICDIHDLDNI